MIQKTQIKINGMHCQSCANLIEEKLNNLSGVVQVKIDYKSGKGEIVYDKNTIKEAKIHSEIKNVGEYDVEKIENIGGRKNIQNKIFSASNLSVPISIIIAGLIIAGAVFIKNNNKNNTLTGQTAQVLSDSDSSNPSSPPKEEKFDITKDDHVRGDFNAPITLVEFSDFECPFCGLHYPTLNKILADYKGKVRLVYKHFPLGFHPNAQKAAEASECASEQGKFWEYHDKLFENLETNDYGLVNFKQWAEELGLGSQKFNDCLDSGKFAQKVQADSQEGAQKGVNGTPATFVNGQLAVGAQPYESFKKIIDGLLNK